MHLSVQMKQKIPYQNRHDYCLYKFSVLIQINYQARNVRSEKHTHIYKHDKIERKKKLIFYSDDENFEFGQQGIVFGRKKNNHEKCLRI